MALIYILFAAFVVLQVLDIYTTRKVLSDGGKELNPLLVKLFERFGVDKTLLVTKAAAVAIFAAMVYAASKGNYVGYIAAAHAAVVAFYAFIVYRNFKQM